MQQERRQATIQQSVVTAKQMQAIESRLFAAGFPVEALMEKVAGRITEKVCCLYPLGPSALRVGVLVGPGHNGGDALVVARELFFRGYEVVCYQPFATLKPLTADHARYVASLGITFLDSVEAFATCDLIIDGLFGFGLNRELTGAIAHTVDTINALGVSSRGYASECFANANANVTNANVNKANAMPLANAHPNYIPIVSIDLPSGIHTDTGAVLGTAVQATYTLCLGLWKQGLLQDEALAYAGQVELIDFDIPWQDIEVVLGAEPLVQRITPSSALQFLPLPRSLTTHKYKEGHVLLICGSQQYMGAAILTGLAARASGVGLLSIAVPSALKTAIAPRIPDAITIACPETESGVIARLPNDIRLDKYDAIACGPGLSNDALPLVEHLVEHVSACDVALLLDADGLNGVATLGVDCLKSRSALTVLTPHLGEFRRLFPGIIPMPDRVRMARDAATISGAMVVLKGGRVAIAHPDQRVWINPDSTPALARGGSGDVLTGLMAGLMAQAVARGLAVDSLVPTAVWWHAQAGHYAAHQRTELGVDAETLTSMLIPLLRHWSNRSNQSINKRLDI